MKIRKSSLEETPSTDGEIENWIADLHDGETSVRRLRKRLDAQRDPADVSCPTCSGHSAGHTGHLARVPTTGVTAAVTAGTAVGVSDAIS